MLNSPDLETWFGQVFWEEPGIGKSVDAIQMLEKMTCKSKNQFVSL